MTAKFFINTPNVTSMVEWDGANLQEILDWYAAHSLGEVGLVEGVLVSPDYGEIEVGSCISQYGWCLPPGGIPNWQEVPAQHVAYDTTPVTP